MTVPVDWVEICVCTEPKKVQTIRLPFVAGKTVKDYLKSLEAQQISNSSLEKLALSSMTVGIYAQKVSFDTKVNVGDRIELYRPLLIDPKSARRLRNDVKKRKLLEKQTKTKVMV